MPITLAVAFLAGLVSFLSPCVLPIIPGFLAYLGGSSVSGAVANRREIFLNSLAFVLGFAIVFATLGVLLNTVLASATGDAVRTWLSRAGGALIVFFGLSLARLIRVPFLEREYKLSVAPRMNSRYLTSLLFGFAFAAGWTPCVGAVLGGILALAATSPGSSFTLLLVYSLGLGLPFLAVGLFTAQASALINRYAAQAEYASVAFGFLLIALGVLVFTESLTLIFGNFDLLNSFLLQ